MRELAIKSKKGAIAGGVLGGIVSIVPSTNMGEPGRATAVVASGVGLGAIIGAIGNSIDSIWSKGRIEDFQKNVSMDAVLDDIVDISSGAGKVSIKRYLVEDQDPRKFEITAAIKDGQGIIILNDPKTETIDLIYEELEDIVAENRFADYTSIKTKSGYEVYLKASKDDFCGLLYDLTDTLKIKVNCITDETIKKYTKQ